MSLKSGSQPKRPVELSSKSESRIFGNGEMADLTRDFDWSSTVLGPVELWPDTLLVTVNTLLGTRNPMFLWWGPELIQFYNDAYRRSLGSDKHPKALGQRGRDCWPEIWHIIGSQIEAVMTRGESSWHEDQLVPIYREGKLEDVYWTYSYSPVRDAGGVIRGTLVTCSETTGRVLAEEALRANDARQTLMLNLMKMQREITDPDEMMLAASESVGRFLDADRVGFFEMHDNNLKFLAGWSNGRLPLLTGTLPAEIIGTRYLKEVRAGKALGISDVRVDPLTVDSRFGEIGTVSLIGAPIIRSGRWHAGLYVNHSEARRWSDGEIALVRDVGGQTWDAVERVRAEAARDLVAEQLQQVFEATSDAFVSLDRNWRMTFLNRRAKEILAPRGEVVGTILWESFPGTVYEGSPYVATYHRAMDEGISGEFEAYYPEPLNVWLHVMARPTRDGIVVFFRDVTEQKREATAMVQAEKLAAVGRLASSIAHEINNPLEAVTNLLYLCTTANKPEDVKTYLAMAQQELARVTNIATQTLRFHRQSTNARETSLPETLDSVLTLFQGRINNSGVIVDRQYQSARRIIAYEGDLRQVFANLISNALDATQRGDRMILRVRDVRDAAGAGFVRVTVADTGSGMSPETSRHIFEPFFTTKSNTGTGLGLWVSAEILKNHNARIRVRSSQRSTGHGTVFAISFPLNAIASRTEGPGL